MALEHHLDGDRFVIEVDVRKPPLFTQEYNEALTFAEHDIKANWRSYKRQFLQEDENEAQEG